MMFSRILALAIAVGGIAAFVGFGPEVSAESEFGAAQSLAQQIYSDVRNSSKVGSYDGFGRGDRIAIPCASDCTCLANQFVEGLTSAGFRAQRIQVNPQNGFFGDNAIRGAPPEASNWNFHFATVVTLSDGSQYVIDPLVIRSAHLEPRQTWQSRFLNSVTFR